MKLILKEHMGSADEKTKAKHVLQMSTMQLAKDHQEAEMTNMWKEISALTQTLTTLTHNMVDKSSRRRGGGGYKSNIGYESEENEDTRPRNTRSKTKWKFGKVNEKKSYAETVNKGNWKYTLNMPLVENWDSRKGNWWFAAMKEVTRDLKIQPKQVEEYWEEEVEEANGGIGKLESTGALGDCKLREGKNR